MELVEMDIVVVKEFVKQIHYVVEDVVYRLIMKHALKLLVVVLNQKFILNIQLIIH
jgi:hypothetical protein